MTKEEILEYLKAEKYNNETVTGAKVIKELEHLPISVLNYYFEYHKYCIGIKNDNIRPLSILDFKSKIEHSNYSNAYGSIINFKYRRRSVIKFLLSTYDSLNDSIDNNNNVLMNYNKNMNFKSIGEQREYLYCILDFLKYSKLTNLHIDNLVEQSDVPEWTTYYPDIKTATEEQKEFYQMFKCKVANREHVQLKGVLSYVYVYMYEKIDEFISTGNIKNLKDDFMYIAQTFSDYNGVASYAYYWTSECYLYLNDYDSCWEYLCLSKSINDKSKLSISDLLDIKLKTSIPFINASDLLDLTGVGNLTQYGIENREEIVFLYDQYINDNNKQNGMDIVSNFIFAYDIYNLSTSELEELENLFDDKNRFKKLKENYFVELKIRKEKYKEYLKSNNMLFHPDRYRLFNGYPGKNIFLVKPKVPYLIQEALLNSLYKLTREIENSLRVSRNIPKIGEGWISETDLYYKLKNHFEGITLINHARTSWLGNQHLDIYIPSYNIAIEYQGLQHSQSVEYFGGEKQFLKQQELDLKKQLKCKENDCHLIYVYPNYNIEEVINKIKKHMDRTT